MKLCIEASNVGEKTVVVSSDDADARRFCLGGKLYCN